MSREEWLLDFTEGETDPETRAEMKALLRHSKKDQEIVKSITDTKNMLKEHADPTITPTTEEMDELHDLIMAGIEKTEIKPAPKLRLTPHHRRWAKTASMGLSVLLAALSLRSFLSNKSLNTQWDVSQQIAANAQEKPDEIAQVMTYQNEHDFFVDVASQSLDHLTKEQFEDLLQGKTKLRR